MGKLWHLLQRELLHLEQQNYLFQRNLMQCPRIYLKMSSSQVFQPVHSACKHDNDGWDQETFKSQLQGCLILLPLFCCFEDRHWNFLCQLLSSDKTTVGRINFGGEQVRVKGTNDGDIHWGRGSSRSQHSDRVQEASSALLWTLSPVRPHELTNAEATVSKLLSVLFWWFFHVDLIFYCSKILSEES